MKAAINKHFYILATDTMPGSALHAKPGQQKGAVLILALVMLTVLTLIGLSSMSSSSLELKVANNAQQHHVAFQAAQSRLAFAANTTDPVNPINYLIAVNFDDPPSWPVQTCNPADGCPDSGTWVATATVLPVDCNPLSIGFSMEEGKGLARRYFEITAIGQTTTLSSRSTQVTAVRMFAKNC